MEKLRRLYLRGLIVGRKAMKIDMKKMIGFFTAVCICMSSAAFAAEPVKPDAAAYSVRVNALDEDVASIEAMISECEKEQISCDYEKMRLAILKRYLSYFKEELENGVAYRTEANGYTAENVKSIYDYNIQALEDISQKCSESLTGYLNGTAFSKEVPRIKTSNSEIDGKAVIADTSLNGADEKRKVFLSGFGHYETVRNDLDILSGIGSDIIQMGVGISQHCRKSSGIKDWIRYYNQSKSSAPDCTLERSSEEAHSGSYSLKITNNTDYSEGKWIAITQGAYVEPNTDYTLGLWVKGEDVKYLSFKYASDSTIAFVDRTGAGASLPNWSYYKLNFNSGDRTELRVYITSSGTSNAFYVDDISLSKSGGENLLKNSGFEEDEEQRVIDSDPFELAKYMQTLKEAEDKNMKVSLLLNLHYFVNELYRDYSDLKYNGASDYGGIGYHVTHPIAKEAVKYHIKTLVSEAKKYKSLNDICMLNEPWVVANDSYYKPLWAEHLRLEYGTIAELNSCYSTNYSDFGEVPFPSSVRNETPQAYDYKNFNDNIMTEWIAFISECVKEVAPEIPVHVKAMSYVGYADEVSGTRWRIGAGLNQEKIIDYIDINGNDAELKFELEDGETYSAFMERKALHKSMWYDFLLSIKNAPVFNSEDHIIANGDKDFSPAHAKNVFAENWQGAIHGRSMSAVWIWERDESRTETYESVLYRPDVAEALSTVNLDLNRLADSVYTIMDIEPTVGILYSGAARIYQKEHMNSMYKAYKNCLFNGVKPGFVTESQLEKLNNYGLVIVPSVKYMPKETIDALYEYVQGGGRLMIIGSMAEYDEHKKAYTDKAYKDKISSIKNSAEIISDKVNSRIPYMLDEPTDDILFEKIGALAKSLGLADVEIIDNATGKPARDVEFLAEKINSGVLINICNYDWDNDKNISIYIDGKKVESKMTELRSEKALNPDFDIASYQPVLIKAEVGA